MRKLFVAGLALAALAMVIDLIYWPEFVGMDVLAMVWTGIWLAYFSMSKRVWWVFHEHTWPPTSGESVTPRQTAEDKTVFYVPDAVRCPTCARMNMPGTTRCDCGQVLGPD